MARSSIVLTASNGNGGSKVAVEIATAAMNLTWETDDVITVSGGAEGMLTLKSGAGDDYATFEGDITIDEGGEIVFTVGGEPNYLQQDGTIEGGNGLGSRIYLVGTSEYKEDGNYSVDMKLPYAVLKLDVSALGTSGAMTIKVGETLKASVTEVSEIASEVFVAVRADGIPKAYTISCGGKTATKT